MNNGTQQFTPQPQCALLRMPAEIRNAIYEFVLRLSASTGAGKSGDHGNLIDIRPRVFTVMDCTCPTINPSVLCILQTCRQIHHEAEQIFYSSHNLRYTVLPPSALPGWEADTSPSPNISNANFPAVSRTTLPDFPGLESYTSTPHHRKKNRPSFIPTLSPRRQQALQALTINTLKADWALAEIRHNIPRAPNLQVLHLQLPLLVWDTDDAAVAWARSVQTALRTTSVKEVRLVRHPSSFEFKSELGRGGASNNSYVVIQGRSVTERAWELSREIEGMLRSSVEDHGLG